MFSHLFCVQEGTATANYCRLFQIDFFLETFSKKSTAKQHSKAIHKTERTLTAMHAFDVNFQLLGLAKLSATKVTKGSGSLGIGSASVGSMHVQVVETKEKL